MDLAGTPTLPRMAAGTRHAASTRLRARLLSAQEAAAPAFQAAWEELAENASEPNPFFEPWFLLPSIEQFGDSVHCSIFSLYDGERLIGLVPLARRQPYYGYAIPHVAIWLHDNAFCGGPLVSCGHERVFWDSLFTHLDGHPGAALFLHCPELVANGALNQALDAVLRETGRPAATVETGERAMLASKLDPATYLEASMSAKKRKELRRQRKRLSEEGTLVVERSADNAGIEGWITDFLALEAAGWKGDAGSALADAKDTRRFFTDALTAAADANRLERLTLCLDGRPIAMLANFITPPGAFSFKTTFDETYSRFSPGLLLQIENLDLLTQQEIAFADSCAVEGHSMIERIWREKRRIVSRNIAIGGSLRKAAFRALMAYETRGQS